MATAAQNKALEVLKDKVMNTDERYDGYHDDLTGTLYDILALENERTYNISQQVSRLVAALGELLVQKEGNLE